MADYTLPCGTVIQVDPEDIEKMGPFRWYLRKSGNGKSYVVASVPLHRFVTDAPTDVMVDHRSGVTTDNRKANLRFATNAQNQQNTGPRGGTSRFKGVSWVKSKKLWRGAFRANGEFHWVGWFDDEVECARAVDIRRKELCGDFARLNLPA